MVSIAVQHFLLNIYEVKIDAERLVEAVRARPVLMENNQKSYKDAEKKAATFKAVAAEMGLILMVKL